MSDTTETKRWGRDYLTIEGYDDEGFVRPQGCPVGSTWYCCCETDPELVCVSYVGHRIEGRVVLIDCEEVELISGRPRDIPPATVGAINLDDVF